MKKYVPTGTARVIGNKASEFFLSIKKGELDTWVEQHEWVAKLYNSYSEICYWSLNS